MASSKPDLTRDGTMQVTAKEGIAMLKAAGKDTLLEMQGLKDPEEDKPAVNRATTMESTAKEGQSLLAGASLDPDATTRGQQRKLDELKEEEDEAPAPKKPKMSKATTMVNTAKEAKDLLGANAPDADALTRGQQKKIENIQAEKPSPKKPKLSKNTTMAATAKEGTALLEGQKLGDTRQETKSKKSTPAGPKRSSTMQKTMEEAKYFTDNVDINEGRRTRSASKPKPALKKAGTMQVTAKEGKEFLQRGKKGKKAKKVVEPVEEEEEEVSE
ncbi:hypothetical protein ACF0H5_019947 [Mactra antiquata]